MLEIINENPFNELSDDLHQEAPLVFLTRLVPQVPPQVLKNIYKWF